MLLHTLDEAWARFRWFLARTLSIIPLVFLRTRMGARFITVPHILMGAAALSFAVLLEGADIVDLEKANTDAEQTIAQCHDNPSAVLYGNFHCASHLRLAHWLVSHPPVTFSMMFILLVVFVLAGLAQLVTARLRSRHTDTGDVLSYEDGMPRLAVLTFGRFPVIAKVLFEPLLIACIAAVFLFVLRRYRTCEFFGVMAGAMCVLAVGDWVRNFNADQSFKDWASRMGLGQGSMKRAPTRPAVRGGLLRNPGDEHQAGIARLRAFAAVNRARMLDGIDEKRPVLPQASPPESHAITRQDAAPQGDSPAPAMEEPELAMPRERRTYASPSQGQQPPPAQPPDLQPKR